MAMYNKKNPGLLQQTPIKLDHGLDDSISLLDKNRILQPILKRANCRMTKRFNVVYHNFMVTHNEVTLYTPANARRVLQSLLLHCHCRMLNKFDICSPHFCQSRPFKIDLSGNYPTMVYFPTGQPEYQNISDAIKTGALFAVQTPFVEFQGNLHEQPFFAMEQPRAYKIFIPVSQSLDETAPEKIADKLEVFLATTHQIHLYQHSAFPIHLSFCGTARGGISLLSNYALLDRSFRFFGPDSKFGKERFPIVPKFALSMIPGQEPMVCCNNHKVNPAICGKCLKQISRIGNKPPKQCTTPQCQPKKQEAQSAGQSIDSDIHNVESPVKSPQPQTSSSLGSDLGGFYPEWRNRPGSIATPLSSSTLADHILPVLPISPPTVQPGLQPTVQPPLGSIPHEQEEKKFSEIVQLPPHDKANLQNPGKLSTNYNNLGQRVYKTPTKQMGTQTEITMTAACTQTNSVDTQTDSETLSDQVRSLQQCNEELFIMISECQKDQIPIDRVYEKLNDLEQKGKTDRKELENKIKANVTETAKLQKTVNSQMALSKEISELVQDQAVSINNMQINLEKQKKKPNQVSSQEGHRRSDVNTSNPKPKTQSPNPIPKSGPKVSAVAPGAPSAVSSAPVTSLSSSAPQCSLATSSAAPTSGATTYSCTTPLTVPGQIQNACNSKTVLQPIVNTTGSSAVSPLSKRANTTEAVITTQPTPIPFTPATVPLAGMASQPSSLPVPTTIPSLSTPLPTPKNDGLLPPVNMKQAELGQPCAATPNDQGPSGTSAISEESEIHLKRKSSNGVRQLETRKTRKTDRDLKTKDRSSSC